jgi:hypothetical protein
MKCEYIHASLLFGPLTISSHRPQEFQSDEVVVAIGQDVIDPE